MTEDTQLTDEEIAKLGTKEIVIRWLMKQGPVTFLLFAILLAIGYGGYYTMTTAIPLHLQQIQAGYDRIANQHETTVQRVIASQDKEREALYRLMDRRVSRIETETGTDTGS